MAKLTMPLLVRAYELFSTTDMTKHEIARALEVQPGTLWKNIANIEENGIKKQPIILEKIPVTTQVLEFLKKRGPRTCSELCYYLNMPTAKVRGALKGLIKYNRITVEHRNHAYNLYSAEE